MLWASLWFNLLGILCNEDIAGWISTISSVQNFVKNGTTIQRIFAHITDGEYDSFFFKLYFVYYTVSNIQFCIIVQAYYWICFLWWICQSYNRLSERWQCWCSSFFWQFNIADCRYVVHWVMVGLNINVECHSRLMIQHTFVNILMLNVVLMKQVKCILKWWLMSAT